MYGKCRLYLCRSRSHIWLVAYSLLQVAFFSLPCLADFGSTDSTNLQNCRRLLSELVYGDPNLANAPDSASSFDHLTDIWEVLRFVDFQQLGSDVEVISTKLDYIHQTQYDNYIQLQNIAANTEATAQTITHISDRIEQGITVNITNDFIVAMTNAFAAIPRCYCVATNFVGSPVDLSIVSNLLVSSSALPFYTLWYPSIAPYFNDFLSDFFGVSSPDLSDVMNYYSMSQMGFLNFLLVDALFPSFPRRSSFSGGFDNLFYSSWINWKEGFQDGTGSTYVDWPYSIFDAYNTLGLGVLTNQAASLISIAHANTNLLTRILAVLDDDEHGLKALAIASANSYASISNALGSIDQADLDHSVSYEMPEWEPTYGRYANSNTNHVEWDDALGVMTRNIFGNTTNQINDVASSIGDIAASDLSLQFNFSGFELTSAGPIGSWSVLAALTDDATIAEAKNLFRSMSSFMFYVLDLCIVVLGCRRIQRALIGDVGIL